MYALSNQILISLGRKSLLKGNGTVDLLELTIIDYLLFI
jgi:hypothetical protein